MVPAEQRVFTRVPFAHAVRWTNDRGESGVASLRDISRTGAGLALGSYFRPGPVVHLTFEGIQYRGEAVQVTAIIVWCRPDANNRETFFAGFKIVHGEGRTLGAMSEVFYTALRQYAEAYC